MFRHKNFFVHTSLLLPIIVLSIAFLYGCRKTDPDCPDGMTLCDGQCVTVSRDLLHCGSCNAACAAGFICENGSCVLSCQEGLIDCNGTCINPDTERSYCGATPGCGTQGLGNSGAACAAEQICSNGVCTDPSTSSSGACCIPRAGVGAASKCLDSVTPETCAALEGVYSANSLCSSLATCSHQLTGSGACCELFYRTVADPESGYGIGFGNLFSGGCRNSATPGDCTGIFYDGRGCSDLLWTECPATDALGPPGACHQPRVRYQSGENLIAKPCLDDSYRDECLFAGGEFQELVDCASTASAVGSCTYGEQCEDFKTEVDCAQLSGLWSQDASCRVSGCCCFSTIDFGSYGSGFLTDPLTCDAAGGTFTLGVTDCNMCL